MKHLKVWQKLALMVAVFMLPFAVVTYKLVASVNALGLDVTKQELRGLEHYWPALELVQDLQLHRDMVHTSLRGDQRFAAALPGKRGDVEAAIKTLDEVEDRLMLLPAERWNTWRDAARALLGQAATLPADESFARHSRLIGDAIAMIREAGHASNLTLDADIARSQLVDAMVEQGPALAEALARARGLGAGLTAGGTPDAAQLERLRRDATLVEHFSGRFDAALQRAFASNEALRPQLEARATAASDAVLDAMAAIVGLSTARQATDSSAYFNTLSTGIDTLVDAEAQAAAILAGLLNERVTTLRRDLLVTLGWAILGLVVVSLIAVVIIRDITVPLRAVVARAGRFSVGDYGDASLGDGRHDEIGGLMDAFDTLSAGAHRFEGVAQRLAAGDLSVEIAPRSPQDILGRSMAGMVERLRTLLGDVQRSGIQVNTSVTDIAATARQQQATASEIAATTSEIGATSKQISATSRELVRTMTEVAAVADQTAALADSGQAGLSRMGSTMTQVMDAAASINGKLAVLSEKAGNINQVVTTITKVADQTNLLSLNAAIEAEKAGEYGRGFAVVATEIRRLADQTAVATYDIDQMVREIQSAVAAGVMGMDKFSEEVRRGMREVQEVGGQLSQIIQQVQALAPRVEAVNEGMQAQSTGAEQITQALAQLSDAAQQTVQSLRQSSGALDSLNLAATGMHTGVSRFKLAA